MSDYLWKSLLTEFLGTFTLVFVGAGAVALTAQQGGSLVGSAFAFGLALMAIMYTWGTYSGAHVNPAVSFGFALSGRMNWGLMIGYWIAQLLGGIAAGALIAYFFGTASGAGASIGSLTNTNAWQAVLLEAFLTFFLVLTVLFVTRNPTLAVASGLAIGLVLTFDMLMGAPLTGASMNPARSLGPAIFSNNMGTYWIYVVGPLLGALVAALFYRLYTADWGCCVKRDECGNVVTDDCGRAILECRRPVLDSCGKPVVDCDGKKYETYEKHDTKINHHQQTYPSQIGSILAEHGYDPNYVHQEITRAVEKAIAKPQTVPAVPVVPVVSTVPGVPVAPPTPGVVPVVGLPKTTVPPSVNLPLAPAPASTPVLTSAYSTQPIMGNPIQTPVSSIQNASQNFLSSLPNLPAF